MNRSPTKISDSALTDNNNRRSARAKQTADPAIFSRKKLALFAAITLVLCILLLECITRVAGFGGIPPFFSPVLRYNNSELLKIDQDSLRTYFGEFTRRVGSVVHGRILVPKAKETLRVVIVGESSVQGFPYQRNLAAASFLQAFLQARSPGRRVEVVNCGVTAIASFPVRRIAEEALQKLQPDLLVVYTGHNEFYGAWGVASAKFAMSSPGWMRVIISLKGTGLFQSIVRARRFFSRSGPPRIPEQQVHPDDTSHENLMQEMSGGTMVSPDSKLREIAAENFHTNLQAVIQAAHAAKVPVLLCQLASNERDFRPVLDAEPPAAEREEWQKAFARALAVSAAASGTTNTAEALQLFAKAEALHSKHASTQFEMARLYDRAGNIKEAITRYRRAIDLDAMPWRAPATTRREISELRKQGVSFCDIDAAFHYADTSASLAAAISNGTTEESFTTAPGWRRFADHLHPSLEGQALMAAAMTASIERDKLLPIKTAPPDDWHFVAKLLGENPMVHYRVAVGMARLFEKPPLNRDPEALRHAQADRDKALAGMNSAERRAASRYDKELASGNVVPSISYLAGEEELKDKDYAAASIYFRHAMEEIGRFSIDRAQAAAAASEARFRAGRFDQAAANLVSAELDDALQVQVADKTHSAALARAIAGMALLTGDRATFEKESAHLRRGSTEANSLTDLQQFAASKTSK